MVKNEKLTSVKITQPLFDKFKMACLEDNFSFKKLADRAIFLCDAVSSHLGWHRLRNYHRGSRTTWFSRRIADHRVADHHYRLDDRTAQSRERKSQPDRPVGPL